MREILNFSEKSWSSIQEKAVDLFTIEHHSSVSF